MMNSTLLKRLQSSLSGLCLCDMENGADFTGLENHIMWVSQQQAGNLN